MHRGLTLATLATLVGLGGAAQAAETLAAGPAYGGLASEGGTVTCRVFNFDTSAIAISKRQIYDNVGDLITLTSDTCNVPLAGTKTCAYAAPITGNLAYSCRIVDAGTNRAISGVVEIQSPDDAVLLSLPLHR